MAEMKISAAFGHDDGDDPRRLGPMVVGGLLVGIGAVMLAERMNALPEGWRAMVWPILLMTYGVARLLQPARRGRRGLFFVLAGAWWLAGLAGWLALDQTWPLLIVAFGASVVMEALTAVPGVPSGAFPRRHSGAMSWVLVAILVGAFLSGGGGHAWSTRTEDAVGSTRMIAVASRGDHHVPPGAFRSAEVVTVAGRNEIDLREVGPTTPNAVTIDGLTTMGATVIRVPPEWDVDLKALAVFGQATDARPRRPASAADDAATQAPTARPRVRLTVRGAVIMGRLVVTS